MSAFASAEDTWRQRLRMLPNTVRQELVTRELQENIVPAPARVLDVGCGQGTQALRLAELGYDVVGVDHSSAMLSDFERALAGHSKGVRRRVRLIEADAICLPRDVTAQGRFDVILCHGVLMYLPAPGPALAEMSQVLTPNGNLSLLVRNADALAMHPGLKGDWRAAREALGETGYTNRVGVEARADRISDLTLEVERVGLSAKHWYGVLTFAEYAAMESAVPGADQFAEIVACEQQAGRTDPYRRIAAMLHVIAGPSLP